MPERRVLLLQMPMGLVQVPNLGLSLLKGCLTRADIPCDIRYLNVELVQRFIGGDAAMRAYVALVETQALAEVCAAHFADLLGARDPRSEAVMTARLASATADQQAMIDAIVTAIPAFLDYCLDSIDWSRYGLVGFNTMFAGMTVPSMALAARIKQRLPHLPIVLGGWNTGGPMGEVLAEKFPQVDFVLRGEAETAIVPLAQATLSGEAVGPLPGLVRRARGGAIEATQQALVTDLDALPIPDFDDYFRTVLTAHGTPRKWSLPFESSRGCWWGQTSHCKFCGLNGLSMPFRSKSPARFLSEIDHLVERYRPSLMFASDTILDADYYDAVLPALRARHPDVRFAYEIKAPVRRDQMQSLSAARVDQVTVGIESLSTRVLRLMGKGSTLLHNVHCLRLAAETGLQVGWQYLVGFPYEQPEDYETVIAQMPLLHHLEPPSQACMVTVARFSPYFERAADHGVGRLRPLDEYFASYRWPEADVMRVAYHFDYEHQDGREPGATDWMLAVMSVAIDDWKSTHAGSRLDVFESDSMLAIVDTRASEPVILILDGLVKDVYSALDSVTSHDALARLVQERRTVASSGWRMALFGVETPDDEALMGQMATEAAAIGAAMFRLSDAVGADNGDSSELVDRIVAMLQTAGLVLTEGNRSVALGVPRTPRKAEARPSNRPRLLPLAS